MFNVTDILGYNAGVYDNSTDAHAAVLKQLPLNAAESNKVLGKLNRQRVGENVWVSYGGASVLVKKC